MDQGESCSRDRVCVIADGWIGTPFHDCARIKGAGTDCAQLLLCVFQEAGLIGDVNVGPYSPQWFLHQKEERYLAWVRKFAGEIPLEQIRPADIVIYKIGHVFAHGAIVVKPGWPHIIHAHAGGKVVRRGFGSSPHLGMAVQEMKFFSLW
jgi:cell wall-associated NlpC family hydrolase